MVPRPGVTNSGGLPSPHPTANASVGRGEKSRAFALLGARQMDAELAPLSVSGQYQQSSVRSRDAGATRRTRSAAPWLHQTLRANRGSRPPPWRPTPPPRRRGRAAGDEPQGLGWATSVRHPQEVCGVEPTLGRPHVPDELDALPLINEYAIQIEQNGATLHGRNGMNLLRGTRVSNRPSHGLHTGLHTGLYTPPTPHHPAQIPTPHQRAPTHPLPGSL